MLILKPRDELTAEDIRNFCRQFDEGIRVEYKRNLDQGVRDSLPKVVSSFANSYGGVLVVGIRTQEGKPVEPIEGFDKPSGEELTLTAENICHQGVYPMLTPLVTEVASDVAGKVFLVIEVEPSSEAPHAIENSRKVYIRTGSASNPYDLADIDLLERLIKRRENVLRQRQRFESDGNTLVQKFGRQAAYPKVRVIVGPQYPHSRVADRERIFQFLRDTRFRGGHFYIVDQLRRLPNGTCGTRDDKMFGYVDTFGHVFHQEVAACRVDDKLSYYSIADLIHPVLQASYCAFRLYESIGFRSETLIEVKAFELLGHVCITRLGYRSQVFEPNVEVIPAEHSIASEHLWERALEITTLLTHQLVWPMKQGHESITEEEVRHVVGHLLGEYRP